MPTFRVKESTFGAPPGIYNAEFLGIAPFKGDGTPRMGRDGKPMPPAIEWQFKVIDGDFAGQIIGRITSAEPTVGNSCGQLIRGLIGHTPTPEEDVNTDTYNGEVFQVVVSPSKENPEKAYVTQVIRPKTAGPAAKPVAPKPAAAAPLPSKVPAPPPKKLPVPPPDKRPGPADDSLWFVHDGISTHENVSAAAIRAKLGEGSLNAAQIQVMPADQSEDWNTADHFLLSVPF